MKETLDETTNPEGDHRKRAKVSSEVVRSIDSLANHAHGRLSVMLDLLAWPRMVRTSGNPWLSLDESIAEKPELEGVARNNLEEQGVDDEWKEKHEEVSQKLPCV
jgi:hypothetical protein